LCHELPIFLAQMTVKFNMFDAFIKYKVLGYMEGSLTITE